MKTREINPHTHTPTHKAALQSLQSSNGIFHLYKPGSVAYRHSCENQTTCSKVFNKDHIRLVGNMLTKDWINSPARKMDSKPITHTHARTHARTHTHTLRNQPHITFLSYYVLCFTLELYLHTKRIQLLALHSCSVFQCSILMKYETNSL